MQDTFIHDFGKFKMVLDNNDSDVSMQVREYGWYRDEKFDLEILQANLKPGMTFLDLGANVGFYTFFARSIVGEGGRVFAFEPFPRNAELIRSTIRENAFKNVTLVEAAVSDKNGKSALYLSPDASSEHSMLDLDFQYGGDKQERKIEVNVVTVDSFFEGNVDDTKVDFVKMDIEGSEYRAINGMKKIIENNRRLTMLIEFWPNGFRKDKHDPYDFLETLVRSGFDISFIDDASEKLYPVQIAELRKIEESRMQDPKLQNKVMQTWGWYTNLLCIKST